MASEGILLHFTELADLPGARLLSFNAGGGSPPPGVSSVHIDSRQVREGGLFVALSGARQDGHSFVEAAFNRGAAAAMVEEAKLADPALGLPEWAEKMGKTLIAVPHTLRGLQDAARCYLKKFPGLLKIGITGSSGKTTTKEIAAAIIGAEKKVIANPGNLNSETGLPLAVFDVRPGHEVGIFEMGMNRVGEIGELARILEPHIALITNIGSAHIGILGSRGLIAKEKKNIFSRFSGTETALIPGDDEFKDFLAEGVKGRVSFYGAASFKEWEGVRDLGLEGSEIRWAGERVRFGLPGKHNIRDAVAAIAIGREVPVGNAAIRGGLESARPLFGRSEIIRGRVTVIRDCYNASPESSAEALGFCDGLDWEGRKIYVLGAMLELGENSREAHEAVGRALAASRADMVFLFGEETAAAAEVLERAGGKAYYYAGNMGELAGALEEYVRPGDLVLLKGSRGNALEQLSGVLAGSPEKSPALAGRGIG
ncbi:MAG: UDP-N-acetylmuramoyl-tripeptide--D-alanyl-D-alanine ligase [Treponema sp.]|jgi:UDP-N-acetylmuramoyl-tripeptide--D-alanyl-D-alanine ligase|nr:UDP-N-acetylmuramoyl-tripeptide--D-alanyl-D-alanine ligase [Treponema sp.]